MSHDRCDRLPSGRALDTSFQRGGAEEDRRRQGGVQSSFRTSVPAGMVHVDGTIFSVMCAKIRKKTVCPFEK